jgi:flagellar protein FliT
MTPLQECLHLTERLLAMLREPRPDDRECLVQQIEETLMLREKLLPEIQPPFSGEDRAAGEKLMELNKELAFFLKELHSDILRELNGLELKKASASRYTDPYRTSSLSDGIFYDKRL